MTDACCSCEDIKEIIKEIFDEKVDQCKQDIDDIVNQPKEENVTDKCELLKEEYGLTESFDCAGFITPEGKMINLCINGKTEHDEMVPNHKKLIDYLRDCCVVRFRKQDKRIWVTSECKPTPEQTAKMVEAIKETGVKIFYAYGPPNEECLLATSDPRPLDIQKWISKCF